MSLERELHQSTTLLSVASIFLKRRRLAGAPRLPSEPVQTHPHPARWGRGPVCLPLSLLTPQRAAPAVSRKTPYTLSGFGVLSQHHFGEAFHIPAVVVSEAADSCSFSVFTFLLPQSFALKLSQGNRPHFHASRSLPGHQRLASDPMLKTRWQLKR